MIDINNIKKLCAEIAGAMAVTVQPDNVHEVSQQLSNLLPYLSNLPLLKADVTELYDKAKGNAAIEALDNPKLLNAKQDIQKRWFEGQLAAENALFSQVESTEKNLRSQIEGLRTLVSLGKEQMNLERFGGGGS